MDGPPISPLIRKIEADTSLFEGDGQALLALPIKPARMHIPGEIPDIQSLHLKRVDNSLATLTACEEWFLRLRAVGLTSGFSCDMPLTQAELASALGFSTVHVNRVLQDLRGEGLFRLSGGRLDILDWARLAKLGDFESSYLHLGPSETAAA